MTVNAKVRQMTNHTFQPPPITTDPEAEKREAAALQAEVQKERQKRLAELEPLIQSVEKLIRGVEVDLERLKNDPTWVKKLRDDRAQYRRLKESMNASRDQIKSRT